MVSATEVTGTARAPVVTHTQALSAPRTEVTLSVPATKALTTPQLVSSYADAVSLHAHHALIDAGGAGGYDQSGDATGGDAAGNVVGGVDTSTYTTRRKRAQDSGTAGGNAYTGASSNVDGGNDINHADNQGTVTNGAARKWHMLAVGD